MSEALLEVADLRVMYGRMAAVHGVSLSVREHAVCAILGANGAGKTSIVRAITGFESWEPGRVVGGTVRFEGREVQGWSPGALIRLGLRVVPERSSVFLPLTVAENLRLAVAGVKTGGQTTKVRDMVFELFPVLNLRAGHAAGLLSGGERQMLGIAMRLLANPRVLVLDEVSFGLAPAAVNGIFSALARIRDEADLTILMVEQNVDAALKMADHTYFVQAGQIVSEASPETVRANPDLFAEYTGSEAVDA